MLAACLIMLLIPNSVAAANLAISRSFLSTGTRATADPPAVRLKFQHSRVLSNSVDRDNIRTAEQRTLAAGSSTPAADNSHRV